jgi:hypothetical protein
MTQVTKQLYNDAHAAKAALTTAIEGLKQIHFGHIFDDAKMAEIINLVGFELQAFLNTWQGLIDEGNQAYANRPEELIKQACHRLLDEIPKAIHLEQATLKHNLAGREMKVEDLKKKGFAPAEIDHISPAGPEVDVDASKARVAALEAEAKALEAFLGDAPRYDVGFLANTALKPLLETDKEAA